MVLSIFLASENINGDSNKAIKNYTAIIIIKSRSNGVCIVLA